MPGNYQSAAKQLQTARDFLRWATSRFEEAGLYFGHGNGDAFNEASQLLLYSLKLPVTALPEIFLDARLCDNEKNAFLTLIQKRIDQRIPIPYLTREAWFAGLPFYVDERVLIPRSPFAELIDNQFSTFIDEPDTITMILDMCTGSACIAIAAALAFPNAHVDAVDIDEAALTVAHINKTKHGLENDLTLIQSDLWQNVPKKHYDLIISNPPYVGEAELNQLPAEYYHEPRKALYADDNGLALVERIIIGAADYLSDEGLLFVEVGNSDETVTEKWPETPFLWLDFEQGGHGIFMLTQSQCTQFCRDYTSSTGS